DPNRPPSFPHSDPVRVTPTLGVTAEIVYLRKLLISLMFSKMRGFLSFAWARTKFPSLLDANFGVQAGRVIANDAALGSRIGRLADLAIERRDTRRGFLVRRLLTAQAPVISGRRSRLSPISSLSHMEQPDARTEGPGPGRRPRRRLISRRPNVGGGNARCDRGVAVQHGPRLCSARRLRPLCHKLCRHVRRKGRQASRGHGHADGEPDPV